MFFPVLRDFFRASCWKQWVHQQNNETEELKIRNHNDPRLIQSGQYCHFFRIVSHPNSAGLFYIVHTLNVFGFLFELCGTSKWADLNYTGMTVILSRLADWELFLFEGGGTEVEQISCYFCWELMLGKKNSEVVLSSSGKIESVNVLPK